jgi:hypothetical protein
MPGPRPEFLPGIPYRCFVQTTVVFSIVVKIARNLVFARCIETPDVLIWPKNWVIDPTLRTILGCYDHSGRLEVRTSDHLDAKPLLDAYAQGWLAVAGTSNAMPSCAGYAL